MPGMPFRVLYFSQASTWYKCLWSLFVVMIALSFHYESVANAQSPLTVDYVYNGQSHSIVGKPVNAFTFVFNKGQEKKLSMMTLDWPPYIGKTICKQGWVQQITIAMLASQGYEVTSHFFPWARSVDRVEKGQADILYPEYFIEPRAPSDVYPGTKRLDHLALSEKIPGGPIAFIKRRGETIPFTGDLDALKGEKIGVVRGYQNTPEFDELMDKGFFRIDRAADDLTNVKKLYRKRVNLIIGDPSVIQFSITSAPDLTPREKQQILSSIEVVKPVLQYNHLYYAVSKKRPQWQQVLNDVNQAIAEFTTSGELDRIIQNTNQDCGFNLDAHLMIPHP